MRLPTRTRPGPVPPTPTGRSGKLITAFGVLPRLTGIAMHDAYAAYDCYTACTHAYVNADGATTREGGGATGLREANYRTVEVAATPAPVPIALTACTVNR